MIRIVPIAAAVLGAGVALALLPGAASASPAAAHHHTVTVHVAHGSARVPASTHRGWTRFRDVSARPVSVLRAHAGVASLVRDINDHHYARERRDFPLVTTVDQHSSAYARLRHGTYLVIPAAGGRFRASRVGVLHAAGAHRNAVLPSSFYVGVTRSYALHAPHTVTVADRHWVRIHDDAATPADVLAFDVDPSTSAATISRFEQHPSLSRVSELSSAPRLGIAQSGGSHLTVVNPTVLERGRWMLMTFTLTNSDRLRHLHAQLVTVG